MTAICRSPRRLFGLTVHHEKLARGLVERDRTRRGTYDDVLDPDAVAALDVDAGLDGEGHVGLERQDVAGDQVWILVTLEADAVAGPVEEPLSVTAGRDDRPRDLVHPFARGARRSEE